MSQVIQHCHSSRLRKPALREPGKSLTEILALGRSLELADQHAAAIENESINAIERNKSWKTTTKTKPEIQPPKDKNPAANRSKHPTSQKICRNCGGQYPHDTICPAKGKICHYCKKPNHFKTVCNKLKRKQVQLVSDDKSAETDSDESDDYCYTVTTETEVINSVKQSLPQVSLKLNNVDTSLLIDTGSTVNIIDEETHQKIGKPTLQKIKEPNLYPYGTNNPLCILGQCELLIETKHEIQCHKFFVTKGNHGSLMGYQTAQALNLVKILQNINDPTSTYPNLFKGIGNTPWVSPIVVVPKKDSESVRICVDMRKPNQAILRERHQMPTVEELTSDLNGAKVFSKIDLSFKFPILKSK